MRHFGTHGPVNKKDNYVVVRKKEHVDFIKRIKLGRYIVLFAPRQTGKTTFFQEAINTLTAEGVDYFPVQLNFQICKNLSSAEFYDYLYKRSCIAIESVFQKRETLLPAALLNFLKDVRLTNHVSMLEFFEQLPSVLIPSHTNTPTPKLVLIIDEFDGIPQTELSNFLYTLRQIYHEPSDTRCPYSVGIVGVKSITQLNYDHSISPFNIQDEFTLPSFTLAQVEELLSQYTEEIGQHFAPEVIETLHKQTAGQPFLVNRLAQILTEKLNIPKSEMIQMSHFSQAHAQLLIERNTNIEHLINNIRKDPRFEKMLMRIAFYGESSRFNLDNEIISELATYGIIGADENGLCQILNPIYLHRVLQAFQPIINGLEDEYFAENGPMDFTEYLTRAGQIQMGTLLENFKNFIARAGFRILQVPDTPQEFVGQYLLFTYLDEFVKIVRASMHLEVPTGRGRADLIIGHNGQKYIVETKVWRNERTYQAGKQQLAAYLKSEGETEGYYVVFDYRQSPEPRIETDTVDGYIIHSYIIPVLQEAPSVVVSAV